jgi:hypothetical protein
LLPHHGKLETAFSYLPAQYYTGDMSKHLESLYQNLLNGKLPHNLSWSEAVELVEHLGDVQPHGDDEFVFRVGSQRFFSSGRTLMILAWRKFLGCVSSCKKPDRVSI